MKIEQQIDMIKLIRKTHEIEAKVWRDLPESPKATKLARQTHADTAEVCEEYVKACTAVIESLEKLKAMTAFLKAMTAFVENLPEPKE